MEIMAIGIKGSKIDYKYEKKSKKTLNKAEKYAISLYKNG